MFPVSIISKNKIKENRKEKKTKIVVTNVL
jgi:hypothetical protein